LQAALDQNNHVLLSWANPPDAARVVIVRKTRDYPRNIQDGITVIDADPPVEECTDTSPSYGHFNYYRAFFQDGTDTWLEAAPDDDRVRIRCESSFGYGNKQQEKMRTSKNDGYCSSSEE